MKRKNYDDCKKNERKNEILEKHFIIHKMTILMTKKNFTKVRR